VKQRKSARFEFQAAACVGTTVRMICVKTDGYEKTMKKAIERMCENACVESDEKFDAASILQIAILQTNFDNYWHTVTANQRLSTLNISMQLKILSL
jgi:hypothetical protein